MRITYHSHVYVVTSEAELLERVFELIKAELRRAA
jgi:hypothetical protein